MDIIRAPSTRVNLLLGFVLLSGGWLGWTLTRRSRSVRHLAAALEKARVNVDSSVPAYTELSGLADLDRVTVALNDYAQRPAEMLEKLLAGMGHFNLGFATVLTVQGIGVTLRRVVAGALSRRGHSLSQADYCDRIIGTTDNGIAHFRFRMHRTPEKLVFVVQYSQKKRQCIWNTKTQRCLSLAVIQVWG